MTILKVRKYLALDICQFECHCILFPANLFLSDKYELVRLGSRLDRQLICIERTIAEFDSRKETILLHSAVIGTKL